jgi:hypothetical protein
LSRWLRIDQFDRTLEPLAAGQFARRIDRLAAVLDRATAHGVEVLEAESQFVHLDMARRADGILPVQDQLLAQRRIGLGLLSLFQAGHVRRRIGRRRPRMFSMIHLPRLTAEVRVGFEVSVRMLAWVNSPMRWSAGSPTAETRRR